MSRLTQLVRRFRFGRPIVIVSGLPRSGTSMMMKMLAAGGLEIVTDGVRTADESNPEGYFELEAVKDMEKEGGAERVGETPARARGAAANRSLAWLEGAGGRAVKVVSPLLQYLPDTSNYRVLLMQRPLAEVFASQNAMLARAGTATDVVPEPEVIAQYDAHLRRVQALLASRACFETLTVRYADVIANPHAQAERVARFIGHDLAVDRMASAVNERLYRNRRP